MKIIGGGRSTKAGLDSLEAGGDASTEGKTDDEGLEAFSGPSEPLEVPVMEHESMTEAMPAFLKDEIAPILAAAERAAAQIVDRAREQAQAQSSELERTRRRVEGRINELVAWQKAVEPSIRSLQAKVADIQAKIDDVPELIRKALDPVATAISGLDPTLAEVAAASRPVLDLDPLPAEFAQPVGTEERE